MNIWTLLFMKIIMIIAVKSKIYCPGENGTFYASSPDCLFYYQCQDRNLRIEVCLPWQRFDIHLLTCRRVGEVDCNPAYAGIWRPLFEDGSYMEDGEVEGSVDEESTTESQTQDESVLESEEEGSEDKGGTTTESLTQAGLMVESEEVEGSEDEETTTEIQTQDVSVVESEDGETTTEHQTQDGSYIGSEEVEGGVDGGTTTESQTEDGSVIEGEEVEGNLVDGETATESQTQDGSLIGSEEVEESVHEGETTTESQTEDGSVMGGDRVNGSLVDGETTSGSQTQAGSLMEGEKVDGSIDEAGTGTESVTQGELTGQNPAEQGCENGDMILVGQEGQIVLGEEETPEQSEAETVDESSHGEEQITNDKITTSAYKPIGLHIFLMLKQDYLPDVDYLSSESLATATEFKHPTKVAYNHDFTPKEDKETQHMSTEEGGTDYNVPKDSSEDAHTIITFEGELGISYSQQIIKEKEIPDLEYIINIRKSLRERGPLVGEMLLEESLIPETDLEANVAGENDDKLIFPELGIFSHISPINKRELDNEFNYDRFIDSSGSLPNLPLNIHSDQRLQKRRADFSGRFWYWCGSGRFVLALNAEESDAICQQLPDPETLNEEGSVQTGSDWAGHTFLGSNQDT